MKPPTDVRRDLDDVLDEIAGAAHRLLDEGDVSDLTDGCSSRRAVFEKPASVRLDELAAYNAFARARQAPRWSLLLLERTLRVITCEDRTSLRAAIVDVAALAVAWVCGVDGGDDDEPAEGAAA